MMFPHSKSEPEEFGHSPGNGITPIPLSRDPLATEGEATPGPDDVNPYEENEKRELGLSSNEIAANRNPLAGEDPYAFDDVDEAVGEVELPSLGSDPETPLFDF